MIKIHYREINNLHRLRISGHAGYAPAGSDIVCAGVSALTCALVDYLRRNIAGAEALHLASGERLILCPVSYWTDSVMEMVLTGFSQIAEAYPQCAEVDRTPLAGAKKKNQGTACDLQLFADGTAAAAPQTAPAEANPAGSSHRPATGESQTPPAAGEDPAEAKRRAFRTLVEGEYKEQYAELFQNAFNRRFREVKGMESRLAAQQGVLELLSRRYNTPEGDLGKLRAAIEAETASYRSHSEADPATRRPDAAAYERRRALQMKRAGQQLTGWLRESADLRSRYPAFDLRAELRDGQFRQLLRSGVGVGDAYQLRHMEEIKADAARAAGEQMAERIRSRGLRPRENGISAQSAVTTGSGVRDLTPAQRREIARRVQRGDTIRF